MPATPEAAVAAPPVRDRNSDILLAFDFGLRRIGVAAGNRLTRTASPVATLDASRGTPWHDIDRLVADFGPGTLVVGLPETSRGPTRVTERAAEFAAALRSRYGLPVGTVDEALTSRAAEAEIRDARRRGTLTRRAGKDRVDRLAASLIAEQWMAAEARDTRP